MKRNTEKLRKVCEALDVDGSGTITKAELLDGYNDDAEFQTMMSNVDITLEDMDTVFLILDKHNSNAVKYDEFIDELHKMKAQDSHTMLVFIKFYVTQIRNKVL